MVTRIFPSEKNNEIGNVHVCLITCNMYLALLSLYINSAFFIMYIYGKNCISFSCSYSFIHLFVYSLICSFFVFYVIHVHDWIYEEHVNNLHQITHTHFDFTAPKGSLEAMQKRKKWRKENNRRNIKEWRTKKADFPFNFYIICFGDTVVPLTRKKCLHRV